MSLMELYFSSPRRVGTGDVQLGIAVICNVDVCSGEVLRTQRLPDNRVVEANSFVRE